MSEVFLTSVPISEFEARDDDLRYFLQTLIEIENRHHERGWDELPPTLYRLTESDDIPVIFTQYPFKAKAFVAQPYSLGEYGDPRAELQTMAFSFKLILEIELEGENGPAWREKIGDTFDDPTTAHVIVSEVWARAVPGDTKEEALAEVGDRHLADIPGSVEARTATLVTDTDYLFLTRERGEEPEVFHIERDSVESREVQDGFVGSMTMLHDVSRALATKLKGEA